MKDLGVGLVDSQPYCDSVGSSGSFGGAQESERRLCHSWIATCSLNLQDPGFQSTDL